LSIRVADTGIGISKDEQERVFERFYRVEKARGFGWGGSGLGLALVKDITSAFGGSVAVESTPGKGSIFILSLPVDQLGSGYRDGDPHACA
jgi:two-component system phosphate regulon sensor histidine kinase PhoR